MKLIIERLDGRFYAYPEDEAHFWHVQASSQRADGRQVSPSALSDECDLHKVLNDNDYIVVSVDKRRWK